MDEFDQHSDDIKVDDSRESGTISWSRKLIGFCTIALVTFFILGLLPDGLLPKCSPHGKHRPHSIEERVSAILNETPLIDGHNDLAILIAEAFHNRINNETFQDQFENGGMPAHVDLPRLEAGQNGGAFWSAFVPCPAKGDDFSDANYAKCELGPNFSL